MTIKELVRGATEKVIELHAQLAALREENERLKEALKETEDAMRFVYTSCATFPQEPQHIQNAAWRRIVNAITEARAAQGQEEA